MENWYLLQTKPRQENRAKVNLAKQQYHIYQPQILVRKLTAGQWRNILEPLFPRYLFILLGEEDNWSKIRSTLGVSRFIRFGRNTLPSIVPKKVVNALQINEKMLTEQLSAGAQFKKGDKVLLNSETFNQLGAVFKEKTKEDRILVLLNLLGKEHTISLAENEVRPLK